MRESCTSGSVRGALSNERPYRDHDLLRCVRPLLAHNGHDDERLSRQLSGVKRKPERPPQRRAPLMASAN
jgi:hypothetical protein